MQMIRQGAGLLRIALACGALLLARNASAQPQAYEVDAGFDTAPQSLYWYTEGIVALNHDMGKDGFLLRAYASLADYSYASSSVTNETINGKLWQFDLMPGYQIVRGAATFGGFVGLDYQDSELDPDDPTNQVRGTKAGAKAEAHFYFQDDNKPFEASLVGQYSTAFATYYTELRLGARICDKVFAGPVAEADGTLGYDGQRLGGYAKYTFELTKGAPQSVTLVAGHQFVRGSGDAGGNADEAAGIRGGPGTYGTLELVADF